MALMEAIAKEAQDRIAAFRETEKENEEEPNQCTKITKKINLSSYFSFTGDHQLKEVFLQ